MRNFVVEGPFCKRVSSSSVAAAAAPPPTKTLVVVWRSTMCFLSCACGQALRLDHLTLEMLAYGRQKPAFSHFVARIFKKIPAEQLTHFIRYLF